MNDKICGSARQCVLWLAYWADYGTFLSIFAFWNRYPQHVVTPTFKTQVLLDFGSSPSDRYVKPVAKRHHFQTFPNISKMAQDGTRISNRPWPRCLLFGHGSLRVRPGWAELQDLPVCLRLWLEGYASLVCGEFIGIPIMVDDILGSKTSYI